MISHTQFLGLSFILVQNDFQLKFKKNVHYRIDEIYDEIIIDIMLFLKRKNILRHILQGTKNIDQQCVCLKLHLWYTLLPQNTNYCIMLHTNASVHSYKNITMKNNLSSI